jgi:GNAT superfamily N-acetyltransferase
VHLIGREEGRLWTSILAQGWSQEHPENEAISAARQPSLCLLAEIEGRAGAAAVLCIHEGVALLGGSATVPELRRRGLHRALVEERMRYGFDHGCDLAMMVAEPGGDS